jgi:hypothetical protein
MSLPKPSKTLIIFGSACSYHQVQPASMVIDFRVRGYQNEDEEPRLTRREVGDMIQRTMSQRPCPKSHYINGMYIKI